MTVAARKLIPKNAEESIWDVMASCALSEDEEDIVDAVRYRATCFAQP